MKSKPRSKSPQEIELKLSLCGADSTDWPRRLARLPVLARIEPRRALLHNIYFDTPDQQLQQQRVALRLRRVGTAEHPQWLQTLKTAGSEASALSRRGEWESAVAGQALERAALRHTAWSGIDPDGSLFERLRPCCVTHFERTLWLCNTADGSLVELALDLGQIEAAGRQAPIAELELELKAGQPAALFELARELAQSLALLPAQQSKAGRAYLLAQALLEQPQRARPPKLQPGRSLPELAQRVLGESFGQFCHNLDALRRWGDPELVHQARVGWRRFKSALRLFRKVPGLVAPPVGDDLPVLLAELGELRNLEVALTETLPGLQAAYCGDDAQRSAAWQAMLGALAHAATLQRQALRQNLEKPGVGLALLLITEWLDQLDATPAATPLNKDALAEWARRRIARQQRRLDDAQQAASSAEQQHRVRILAKDLRYGLEALDGLLPRRLARRSHSRALAIQSSAGLRRDLALAGSRLAALEVHPAIVEFLRGVEAGSGLLSAD
jgi:inorganic triphosphatase YgiF